MTEIALKCDCGVVSGVASHVTPSSGTRIICFCDDCQAFASYLENEDAVLDRYGGTDIFQMPISHIKITEGNEKIRCVRLTDKGMFRWYTECCKTPIGNTLSAGMPFIGVVHNFMVDTGVRDGNLGPVRGYINTKFAKNELPADQHQSAFPIGIIMRTISKMIVWKLKGLNKPSDFFDNDGIPIIEPNILKSKIESKQ